WHHRATAFARLGQWDKAATDFAKVLSLVPPSNNPWYNDRGAIDSEIMRLDEVFNAVANLRPNDVQLWIARANYHARRRAWQQAAAATAKVTELDPSDHSNWYHESVLQLQLGDIEGYRRTCREMLSRFGQTEDANIAERTAKTCLLVPQKVSESKLVMKL